MHRLSRVKSARREGASVAVPGAGRVTDVLDASWVRGEMRVRGDSEVRVRQFGSVAKGSLAGTCNVKMALVDCEKALRKSG